MNGFRNLPKSRGIGVSASQTSGVGYVGWDMGVSGGLFVAV